MTTPSDNFTTAATIAIAGGSGGAGASVLAAALARSAARLERTLLIDCDRWGGGADLLLGAEDEPGLRWPDLALARGQLLPGSLTGALPVIDGVHVLAWDRALTLAGVPPEATAAVIHAADQEFGVVILDLPRPLDEAGALAAAAADLALLIVPAEVRAAAAAGRVAAQLAELVPDVQLVVRSAGARGLRPAAVARALQLPLMATLRPEPGLRAALQRGEPPGLRRRGPLSVFCRRLVAGLLVDGSHRDGARR